MAHLLLIEDDPTARETVRTILAGDGHIVVCTRNGKISLAVFELMRPDLVATGPGVAGPDRIGAIEAMRAIDPSVPVIALSLGESPRGKHRRMVQELGGTVVQITTGYDRKLCRLISQALSEKGRQVKERPQSAGVAPCRSEAPRKR